MANSDSTTPNQENAMNSNYIKSDWTIDNTPASAINETGFSRDGANITERPLSSVLQLMAFAEDEESAKTHVKQTLGLELPSFSKVTQNADHTLLQVQPQKWLLLSDNACETISKLNNTGEPLLTLDLSSSYTAIDVTGTGATDFLQQFCFVDLSQKIKAINTQMASDYTVTVLKHNHESYTLLVTRSLARSFWDFIKTC